jgi:hypothetical protein
MTDFSGKFQYLAAGGSVAQEGPCRAQYDAETFTLTPESGAPLACDLGDFDAITAADWEIRLPLYTGSTIVLRQFGKVYETLSHDLLEAYRQRTIQCLLLEDMEELTRFNGNFELTAGNAEPRSGAAELRLYKSNLAVLPIASQGFQWRLADIDSARFDADAYQAILQAGPDILKVSKLAKRTDEFVSRVKDAVSSLATASAQALHAAFPFLNPDQLQSAPTVLREGRSAPVAKLAAISQKFPSALAANAVDKDLKPYYDDLLSRTAKDSLYAGFKLIRPEDDAAAPGDEAGAASADSSDPNADASATDGANDGEAAPDADNAGPQTLYWFFFPLAAKAGSTEPANIVAWEASSRAGRATYFFRLVDPAQTGQLRDPATAAAALETSLRRLNRVLGLVNFRRRPIYLSDDELERDPRFHRYAIAARRLPEVREVRASFLGRAIHSSFVAWREQVTTILAKAGL